MPSDWRPLGDALNPRHVLKVNESPLQRAGTDVLVKTAVAGGPEHAGDRRMFLSARLLRDLLAVAEASPTQRLQVDRAGVRVDLYRRADGHTYEVWTFIGAEVRPEPLPDTLRNLSV